MRGNYISDWVISPTISNKGMIVTSSKRNILFNKGNDYEGTFQSARNVLLQKDDVYILLKVALRAEYALQWPALGYLGTHEAVRPRGAAGGAYPGGFKIP